MMENVLTANEALKELDNIHTEDELRRFLKRLDTSTTGSTTIVYSGNVEYFDQSNFY